MLKNILFICLVSIFFIACGEPQPQVKIQAPIIKTVYLSANVPYKTEAKDLTTYPQKAEIYTKNVKNLSLKKKNKLTKEFFKIHFRPWNVNKMSISKKNASWGNMYAKMNMYGENYRKVSKKWFKDVINLANMNKFNNVKRRAITVRNSDLRVFPSEKPIFKRYNQAGEGFPFDYNQNSSINLNSPLFISHYSKDLGWAYVESSFASGWIKVEDIALVDKEVIKIFKKENNYFVAIKDNFPLYKSKIFKDYVKLGTVFPIRKGKFVTIIRDNNGKGYISRVDANKNIVKFPIDFNEKNLNMLISELIDQPYGWGGLYGNRDCSLLTKDLLTPFGFPLQRNSYGQTRNGKYISLEGKTDQEKKDIIKKKGLPFLSLVYIKGHIALYIGIYKNEPLIFHSTWGIKTLKDGIEGRHIIGKSVISSLELGKELKYYNKKKTMINKVKGLILLTK